MSFKERRQERTVVYRLYREDGQLLYVGCTAEPEIRLKDHARRQPWGHEISRCEMHWHDDRPQAEDAERAAIETLRPLHNVRLVVYEQCSKGHNFTPENTRYRVDRGTTYRVCRTCARETDRNRWPKRKVQRRQSRRPPTSVAEAPPTSA